MFFCLEHENSSSVGGRKDWNIFLGEKYFFWRARTFLLFLLWIVRNIFLEGEKFCSRGQSIFLSGVRVRKNVLSVESEKI